MGRRLADKIRTTWSNRNLVLEQPALFQLQLSELEESFVLQLAACLFEGKQSNRFGKKQCETAQELCQHDHTIYH